MHPDDLKTIWECHDCGRKFFYHSDIANHAGEYRHSRVVSRDYTRKKKGAEFLRRHFSLSFRVDGRKARIEIECKYYPAGESLEYTNVTYSDRKLQEMIEGRPEMMNRVDRYLRQSFQTEGEGRHPPMA
jgi:hypothetical protein